MRILALLSTALLCLLAEPSAFEDSSQNLQNDKILEIESKIKALETATEGIKSIYEGQAANINDLNNKFNAIERANANNENLTNLHEQVANNTKNIQTLTESLNSVSEAIAEIKNLLGDIKQKQEDKKEQKQAPEFEAPEFEKDKTRRGEIFKEARKLLNAGKFDEASARYNWFIEIKYKSAESYYMLGRIAYATNKYDDAIYYFKESATLDENASYMPRLMLNCANSLRVLDRTQDAKAFYNSLIKRFPKSSEAKEAKKELQKIK